MTPVSAQTTDRARKNHQAILRGLVSAGQVTVAKELQTSESTISRLKSDGDLERAAVFLAAMGLKVVPIAMRCYEPSVIQAIFVLARRKLERISDPGVELSWEDGE